MRALEFEGAMFEDEIEFDVHYWKVDSLWVVGARIFR